MADSSLIQIQKGINLDTERKDLKKAYDNTFQVFKNIYEA